MFKPMVSYDGKNKYSEQDKGLCDYVAYSYQCSRQDDDLSTYKYYKNFINKSI